MAFISGINNKECHIETYMVFKLLDLGLNHHLVQN